jgi:hypothetical protein
LSDLRALADEAVQHLDRLGAVILDDVGDGPRPQDLAAAATTARDAVTRLAVPALTQLTGLVAGIANSLVAGSTEWNPSLGGTLMAAVDDLRHLASRASQFSDEDSEHLHHRAAELSAYVHTPAVSLTASASLEADSAKEMVLEEVAPIPSEEPAPAQVGEATQPVSPGRGPTPSAPPQDDNRVVPISSLFFSDAGPHIISGGMPEKAAARSDLLGRGIDALDNLTARPIAAPVTFGAMEVVPVETLLYRGRAALERAAASREQIKAAGGAASPATLDEMYDLIGLALKD